MAPNDESRVGMALNDESRVGMAPNDESRAGMVHRWYYVEDWERENIEQIFTIE